MQHKPTYHITPHQLNFSQFSHPSHFTAWHGRCRVAAGQRPPRRPRAAVHAVPPRGRAALAQGRVQCLPQGVCVCVCVCLLLLLLLLLLLTLFRCGGGLVLLKAEFNVCPIFFPCSFSFSFFLFFLQNTVFVCTYGIRKSEVSYFPLSAFFALLEF